MIEKTFKGVEIHFGSIGTEGSRRLYDFDTEREAEDEYRRQIAQCERSGYQVVPDGSIATKPPPPAAPTGKRYAFRDRKRGRFAWVEVDGNQISFATGLSSEIETAKPRVETCASEKAAVKKRDALVAEWMSNGFELATF